MAQIRQISKAKKLFGCRTCRNHEQNQNLAISCAFAMVLQNMQDTKIVLPAEHAGQNGFACRTCGTMSRIILCEPQERQACAEPCRAQEQQACAEPCQAQEQQACAEPCRAQARQAWTKCRTLARAC